jgi:putative transposase
MSKQSEGDCHRCGHAAQWNREFRCPKCGLVYNRDLNACINIARRLMRSADGGAWLLNRQMRGKV